MKYIDMQKQTINTQKGITQRMNYHISCIGMQTFYTNGQCLKNYLLIVVDNGKKSMSKFYENFTKNDNKVKYSKIHNDLPFLPEEMKIKICYRLVCNFCDTEKYFTNINSWVNTKESAQRNSI